MKLRRFWIISVFPEYFEPFKGQGVVGKAISGSRGDGRLEVEVINLREFSNTKYGSVDDYPYGGGAGMIMRADILERALLEGIVKKGNYGPDFREQLEIFMTSPRGQVWSHDEAVKMSSELQKFCESTSLHGWGYIYVSQSLPSRLYWSAVLIASSIVCVLFINSAFQSYMDSDVVITIESSHAPLSDVYFPAITICNMNQVSTINV